MVVQITPTCPEFDSYDDAVFHVWQAESMRLRLGMVCIVVEDDQVRLDLNFSHMLGSPCKIQTKVKENLRPIYAELIAQTVGRSDVFFQASPLDGWIENISLAEGRKLAPLLRTAVAREFEHVGDTKSAQNALISHPFSARHVATEDGAPLSPL
jgi:hypothetical protein